MRNWQIRATPEGFECERGRVRFTLPHHVVKWFLDSIPDDAPGAPIEWFVKPQATFPIAPSVICEAFPGGLRIKPRGPGEALFFDRVALERL